MRLLPKQAADILHEIQKSLYKPKPREDSFFSSVEKAIENDWRLSEKQSKWLQDIYVKSTGGGSYQSSEHIGR